MIGDDSKLDSSSRSSTRDKHLLYLLLDFDSFSFMMHYWMSSSFPLRHQRNLVLTRSTDMSQQQGGMNPRSRIIAYKTPLLQ